MPSLLKGARKLYPKYRQFHPKPSINAGLAGWCSYFWCNNQTTDIMRQYVFLVFSLLFPIALIAQEANPRNQANDLLLEAVQEGHCAGIAAGIRTNDGISWEGKAGLADLDKAIPFSGTTVNRTASISKPMTAVAIMQLHERGLLELDAPVNKYLPIFQEGIKAKITVRHVLQHASGMRAYANKKEADNAIHYPTLAAAFNIIADDALLFPSGTDFNYTSYGYNVLGMIIEEISGMSFADYLRTNIWEPAGMTQTSLEEAGKSYANKATLYHQKKPGKIKVVGTSDLSDRFAGGGIQSSVSDLLHFGNALQNGVLLDADTFAEMMVDSELKKEGNGYGLGWYLYGERPNSGTVIGHSGAQYGVSAFLMLMPEQKTTVAVLSNTSGALQEVSNITVALLSIAEALAEQR